MDFKACFFHLDLIVKCLPSITFKADIGVVFIVSVIIRQASFS